MVTKRFADLEDLIVEDGHEDDWSWQIGVQDTLKWLDSYPLCAPGRTITAHKAEILAEQQQVPLSVVHFIVNSIGVEVSGEKSNEQRLSALLEKYIVGADDPEDYAELARLLDEDGVEAPEDK